MSSISVIVPTRNESGNIKRLLQGIWDALVPYKPQLEYETIVVDDSTDKTAMIAKSLGARVVKGKGKGLGQAIIDGINASQNDIVLVMDADGSHDTRAIPSLLKPILEQGYDLTIGSRYVRGGDYSNWALNRKIKSLVGVKLMQLVTGVRDSNSGFFCFRREIIEGAKLNGGTWKIMLEVLFRGKWISKKEVPITFGDRIAGESKRSTRQVFKDAINLVKLLVWKFRRYITFACVGGIGALWYFGILYALTEYAGLWYGLSAAVGTLVAITNNYIINHYYTFRKEKQRNKSLARGWLKYVVNSGIGDGLDWCVLVLLTEVFGLWYMLSALIASGVASVIKYTIAKKWIWGKKARKASDPDYEWLSFYKGQPWQKMWKQLIANTTSKLVGEGGRVLEVGCGSSPGGLLVDHFNYVGMDADKGKIAYMRGKGLSRAEYVEGDMRSIPYGDKSFDTVLCIETIEHALNWQDAEKAISELARVAKDNGKVVIATPNFFSLTGKIQDRLYAVFQPKAYADSHIVKFSHPKLLELCQKYRLEHVQSTIPMQSDMICLFQKVGS